MEPASVGTSEAIPISRDINLPGCRHMSQVGASCSACVPASQKLFSVRAAEMLLFQLMQLWHRE